MPSSPSLLQEARTAWRYTRSGVVSEVENLPVDALGFRPTPQSRSAAELVRHIVQNARMMCGELTREDGDFTRQSYAAFMKEYADDVPNPTGKEELLQLLRTSHAEGDRQLEAAGEELILRSIRQFDGEYASRVSWLYHGIAHEEYHRGQLALYARLQGHVPALTRLIQGEG